MNAIARGVDTTPQRRKPRTAAKTKNLRPNQKVEVRTAQRDGQGRLLVEAGTRGEALEELRNARGWWIVYYEALMLCWPTRVEELRPVRGYDSGRIHADRLIAVLRVIVRVIRDASAERGRPSRQNADVMALLKYMTGEREIPPLLIDTYQEFHPWCLCGQSGLCEACEKKAEGCSACAGSRICRRCPRLAEGHRKLLDYLARTGATAPAEPVLPTKARALRLKRAA